ncbi:MFS transporter [Caldovatus aquaticus]|uniref:MFS transporter n=1 Tax=Caldovatus aquaticus TaxID=2865671 RepID=A0ABS7EYU2_9PROT|nr:MFS transporter [Caldovatus aquaticus]MBW8268526.1 MFS transporter [Caldovatus aquaticus]
MDTAAATAAQERAMRRNVWLLFCCQALIHATMSGQVTMAALIGHTLSGDKALATLPVAVQMTAVMAASIPAGIVFSRLGRRAGFTLGALSSTAGALLSALAIWRADFLLYCVASAFVGGGFGIGQHYRFAAAEVATPEYRARAISLVMAGGVISAFLGPELVKHTRDLGAPYLFLGTYLALAALPLVCLGVLAAAVLPPPPAREKAATPIGTILSRPAFVTAAVVGLVAFGTMNLVMTSTPVEMTLFCGFAFSDSATVIQAHAVAMYAPGFVTGSLIGRFGAARIIAAGAAMTALCVAVGLGGASFWHFAVALALLGAGWNFMFVGATTLLATAYRPEERMRAQAANDFIVFGTTACTAFLSGVLHAKAGWAGLNLALLPPLAVALALLAWFRRRQRAAAAAVAPA